VRLAGDLLVNVQLDDMLPGVHEHLEFGEGDVDLAGTLAALAEVGYTGVAAVELPRHSHAAPDVARRAIEALHAAMPVGAR
jgi:sugar phosphate isomerase/epimerase